jgi:hypothetical protein
MARPKEFISVKGVNDWVTKFQASIKEHNRDVREALREAADILAAAVKKRVWPAKRRNKQDAKSPRELATNKSVTIRNSETAAEVELRSYWGRLRAQPVYDLMVAQGLKGRTERKELIVDLGKGSFGSFGGEFKIGFNEAPRLEDWAAQQTKADPATWQYHRHTVWLPARVLGPLAMFPARKETYKKTKATMNKAHELFLARAR